MKSNNEKENREIIRGKLKWKIIQVRIKTKNLAELKYK